ncbi:MAG: DEAD/DEAH box helicase [Acidimicrobiia bacterium]|nr:DEAD/DEAH box helicase [Acidimicrobiia bacterium]
MPLSFAELGVPADMTARLAERGFTTAFPIQAATLPDALAGHDICGRAPTGSGKTVAFGIPLALREGKANPRRPRSLVLVPTRELAAQVRGELAPLAAARQKSVAVVYGGTGYHAQLKALRQGTDILVACPGRLEDLIDRRAVDLGDVDTVVIDEADRMADMGFLPAVRRLLDATRPERQTMLFSATLDGDVDTLVRRYQHEPRRHVVADEPGTSGDVHHVFWKAHRTERVRIVADLISHTAPAVVFCRTRHGADRLVRQLSAHGVKASAIHGSRSQAQRERALRGFANGHTHALVATDVAARGIHVDNVSCVVHFDPPADHKDYIHRSGRTGRAGADGTVVSLVLDEQVAKVRKLQKSLRLPQKIAAPEIGSLRRSAPRTPAPSAQPANAGTRPQGAKKRRRRHQSPRTSRLGT